MGATAHGDLWSNGGFWHEADIQVGAPHVRYQGKPDVTQTYLDGHF